LETSTGTTSTILLGLATTRISHEEIPIIRHKSRPQLVLTALINILGIVGNDTLRNGRSNSVNLCRETSSLDSDADVEVGELVFAEDKDGFEGLEAKTFRLDVFDGLAVDLDETAALLGECAGGGGLFPEMGVGKEQ
jgi:hypothetical protein